MRLVVLALALTAARAHAEPTPEFTREYTEGVDAFRLGKLAEATDHLQKAIAIDPKLPGPHRFMAAVAKADSRWADCIAAAREAIALNPQSKEIVETRKLHDDCREAAGLPPYRGELFDGGAIAVTTTPPGATVTINHLMYGGTPLQPRTIPAGTLDIAIAKPGYKPVHLTDVVALPSIVTDVAVALEVDPNASTTTDLAKPKSTQGFVVIPPAVDARIDDQPVAAGKVGRDPGTYTVELRAPGKDPWRRRVRVIVTQTKKLDPIFVDTEAREHTEHLGTGVVSAGLAIVAVGFAATLLAHDAAATAREYDRVERNRDPSIPNSTTVEPLHTQADIDAMNTRAHRDWLIADLAYGVGAATIGLGAYFLYRGAGERSDAPPRFAIVPTTTGAMVTKSVQW